MVNNLTHEVDIDIPLYNKTVIGLMLQGNCHCIDGHIYHNNSVYKIRLDLLRRKESLTENKLLDIYNDVLTLPQGMNFGTEGLLQSKSSHRLAFVVEDLVDNERLNKLIVTPYLH